MSTHHPDRSPGSSDEPGDIGPPDWFAAVAQPPQHSQPPERSQLPEHSRPVDHSQPEESEESADRLPELVRASELSSGRRRRRTALAEEAPDEAPAVPEPGGRRRRSREVRPEEPVDPASRARDICLRLLTGAAKTRKQLAEALHKREIPEDVAEEVLSRFEEVGLIDDAAFAAAWVEARHSQRGLSRRALAQELRTRGVAGELVEQAVAQVDAEDEAEAARALVDRRLRASRGLERDTRMRRLVGMLARRGYSEGLAFRVVRDALADEGDEADREC